jgi:outer membrane scaffolding protein for murein synthesis (MipA/OmpV family)
MDVTRSAPGVSAVIDGPEGVTPLHSGATLACVPTTRPRIMVTETDELAAALNSAASRYPGLSRAQLLTRLALEGQGVAQRAQEDRRRRRLDALRKHSGALTGAYGEHYLDGLRQEWPA